MNISKVSIAINGEEVTDYTADGNKIIFNEPITLHSDDMLTFDYELVDSPPKFLFKGGKLVGESGHTSHKVTYQQSGDDCFLVW